MQENKRYKGLKTGKWISIRSLVPGLLLTARSASTHRDIIHISYTRKNAQVVTDLQTSCNKSVHKLLTRFIRTACSFVGTSLEQAVDKL